MGRTHHSCGATQGILERCNFACTSCYLSENANTTSALPWKEGKKQLDELRSFLGPKGKAQLTAGEVTLLPVEILGWYVAYAKSIDLDPMVMTHGERFLAEPGYLRTLVQQYGLEKISIHVDITQRGRAGWKPGGVEADLHGLRDRYAQLIREIRFLTGKSLKAAHTVTVTEDNLGEIGEIIDWLTGNLDAFRMISFQPVAAVGRTQDKASEKNGLDEVWQRICKGLGKDLNRSAWLFGHPECNIIAPIIVLRVGTSTHIFETARQASRWDKAFLNRVHNAVGGFTTLGKPAWENLLSFSGLAARNPLLLMEAGIYSFYRMWGARTPLLQALLHLIQGKVVRLHPLVIVVHKFMSAEEIDTPLGRERLKACVFKVPVNGNMVSMCELNGTDLRRSINSGDHP